MSLIGKFNSILDRKGNSGDPAQGTPTDAPEQWLIQPPADWPEAKACTQEEIFSHIREIADRLVKHAAAGTQPLDCAGITFIHGKAGSGKTFLINRLENEIEGVLVLVPTNTAATLYNNAHTLHSFFFDIIDSPDQGFQDPANITPERVELLRQRLLRHRIIVIDEISMVRSDMFEMLHQLLSRAVGNRLPFGGIPVVVAGDLFQLPPVVDSKETEEYLHEVYGGPYFFEAPVVKENPGAITLFEPTHSFRQQNDPEFTRLLDAFRHPLTPEGKVAVIERINRRVSDEVPQDAVYIAAANREVTLINQAHLDRLPGPTFESRARYKMFDASGGIVEFLHGEAPARTLADKIVVPTKFDGVFRYKPGARVMLTTSYRRAGYVNGDLGTIVGCHYNDIFDIRIDRTGQTVCYPGFKSHYEAARYNMIYDRDTRRLKRGRLIQHTRQIPLKLGYAFTIHKAQGQTYNKVVINLESHIFAQGQLYVALSRAKSLAGLTLTRPVTYSDIISDESVFDFLRIIRSGKPTSSASQKKSEGSGEDDKQIKTEKYFYRCDDFISFIRLHETDETTLRYMVETLNGFSTMFMMGHYNPARDELEKVIRVIERAYITDRYRELMVRILSMQGNEKDLRYVLNAIFEIYTDVVRLPKNHISE